MKFFLFLWIKTRKGHSNVYMCIFVNGPKTMKMGKFIGKETDIIGQRNYIIDWDNLYLGVHV